MKDNFHKSIDFTLEFEGGNDDDPHDHGGRTSRGILQREWNKWRQAHPGNNWPSDVWKAPQDQVEAIYYEQYWLPHGDELPSGVDLAYFDFAVNAGGSQAAKSLQRALHVAVDGQIGPITMVAIKEADAVQLIIRYWEQRSRFYHSLGTQQFAHFGRGWIRRNDACEKLALQMVAKAS